MKLKNEFPTLIFCWSIIQMLFLWSKNLPKKCERTKGNNADHLVLIAVFRLQCGNLIHIHHRDASTIKCDSCARDSWTFFEFSVWCWGVDGSIIRGLRVTLNRNHIRDGCNWNKSLMTQLTAQTKCHDNLSWTLNNRRCCVKLGVSSSGWLLVRLTIMGMERAFSSRINQLDLCVCGKGFVC